MVCQDLLAMKELKELKLLAGEKGLSRMIRWIYFADSLECTNQEDDPDNWVHNGEIFVLTNNRMLSDTDRVLSLMRKAYEKKAAGFLINVGNAKEEYLTFCNEYSFPLFEIPWSIKLVDLSQSICTKLIQEVDKESALEHLLSNIIYSVYDASEDIVNKSLYYGVDLRQECKIAIFDIDKFYDFINSNKLYNEEKIQLIKESIQRMVQFEFKQYSSKKFMSLIQDDSVIILYPTIEITNKEMEDITNKVQAKLKENYTGLSISVGVGNGYQQVDQLKKSFFEAEKAVKLVNILENDKKILHYQNMGMYPLLFLIDDKNALKKYYHGILGKLEENDQVNHTDLCDTLEVYLKQNNNTSLTAKELFVHRNTLRYRLDKIESILEINLEKNEDVVKLSIAFHIKKYLKILN